MDTNLISEKQFPITNRWLIKSAGIQSLFWIAFFVYLFLKSANIPGSQVGYLSNIALVIVVSVIGFLLLVYRRANFHFSLDPEYLNISQGIFKKSQIHIPYNTIQDVIVRQDFMDRLLGIYLLVIENFSGSGTGVSAGRVQPIGVVGNQVSIPGLTRDHAEALKQHILQKVKQNPSSPTSGV